MTASRIVLIGTRAVLGIATTWLALLLLGSHAPAQSPLVAAMPAAFGSTVAMLAAATLFLAGICLVFRILDHILPVLLGAWGVAVLASAWKLTVPMYRDGNPLLLTGAGWELVITMIALVASAGLAWATRAPPKPTGNTYLPHSDEPVAVPPAFGPAEGHHTFAEHDSASHVPAVRPDEPPHSAVPFAVPPSPIGAAPTLSPTKRPQPAQRLSTQEPQAVPTVTPVLRPAAATKPAGTPTFEHPAAASSGTNDSDPFVETVLHSHIEDPVTRRRGSGHDNAWVNL